ncbi:hypothetical protein [Mycolicibacterium litorale]|uniref:hypothetical protein n=1 Tax=Mycolicibacterium litorale TaxID=758802 RepID=UPI001416EF84|nr:hypothetical protein [Mycolicibacterium litorale]
MNVTLWTVVLIEFAGLVTLGILLLRSRRALAQSRRRELTRRRASDEPRPPRRRKPMGIAPRLGEAPGST